MTIESLCQREPVTIDAEQTLHDAAALMREAHVGCLVATTAGPSGSGVVGVLTDRDLAIEVLARGRDATTVRIAALLSGRLVTVPWDASLSDAIEAMESEGVRRLLVTNEDKELVGVVSLDDLLAAWADDMAALSRSLRNASEREARARPSSPIESPGVPLTVPDDEQLASWRHGMAAG